MGILMHLTNERGGTPPGGLGPINTILILTFRTDQAGQVGPRREHTETLCGAHNCGSANASSARVCLYLGVRKDLVNPHPRGGSYPSSSRGAAAIDSSYSDGMRLIRVMISSRVSVSSVRFFMSLSLNWPDLSS